MRETPTFEAKCADCDSIFDRPSLGYFSYGEEILSTVDGRIFVTVSGFSVFPQRVVALAKATQIWPADTPIWAAIAALADPIDGQPLVSSLVCPSCLGGNFEYLDGKKIGSIQLGEATFAAAERLPTELLAMRIAASASEL